MSAIFHLIIIHVSTTDAKASFAWLVDYFYPSVLVISGYRGDDVDVETGSGLREKIMCRLYRLWRCRGRGGRGSMGRLLLVGFMLSPFIFGLKFCYFCFFGLVAVFVTEISRPCMWKIFSFFLR